MSGNGLIDNVIKKQAKKEACFRNISEPSFFLDKVI